MNDREYLKQMVVRDLVAYVMEDEELGVEEAMALVASSRTMAKVLDDRTGLYRESSAYVYDYLKDELGSNA